MSNDVYILQRDLPDSKAGSRYEVKMSGGMKYYQRKDNTIEGIRAHSYNAEFIENNSEWFKKEEEKVSIQFEHNGRTYRWDDSKENWATWIDAAVNQKRLYTEDDLRNAFANGRYIKSDFHQWLDEYRRTLLSRVTDDPFHPDYIPL